MAAEVEYVTDMARIMQYGIMIVPALMMDGKAVSAGGVLKVRDVAKLLQNTELH